MRRSEHDHIHNGHCPGRALRRSYGLGDMEDYKMSDILIKGFDFPEDCSKCPLRKVPQMRDDICVISGCRVHNYPERPNWCYLHEVKPHGRLIDANELENVLDSVNSYGGASEVNYKKMIDILHDKDLTPTILEAST